MKDKVKIILINKNRTIREELLIPIDISCDELIEAINSYLGSDYKHLVMDNPPAFLIGDKLLKEYGIHNASILICE